MDKKPSYKELEQRIKEIEKESGKRKQEDQALRKREKEKEAILNSIDELVVLQDREYKILWANKAARESADMTPEQLVGCHCYKIWAHRSDPCPDCSIAIAIETGYAQEIETYTSDGKAWFIRGYPIRDIQGNVTDVVETALKISERKKAKEKICHARKDWEDIFQAIGHSTLLLDPQQKIIAANCAAVRAIGISENELVGKKCYEVFHGTSKPPEDCPLKNIRNSHNFETAEMEIEALGGTFLVSCTLLFDEAGHLVRIIHIATDITEHKRAGEALQESEKRLRLLSSQLITAQEKERRRVSVELHDELGQALMVLKLKLRSMREQLNEDQTALKEECKQILNYIDDVTENVRRLSRDLRPSILEDLGLLPALRWLIDEFTKHHHIESKLDIVDTPDFLSKEDEIIIFRIFQEALTNIGKHAQATNVSVIIKLQDGMVSFVVEDNGKGFNREQIFTREATERGMGFAVMEERIQMVGGFLDIWSQEGTGTIITFSIPID